MGWVSLPQLLFYDPIMIAQFLKSGDSVITVVIFKECRGGCFDIILFSPSSVPRAHPMGDTVILVYF
jgi:hypothetical protein